MRKMEVLLPPEDLMPYEHLELCTKICDKLSEVWETFENSDIEEGLLSVIKLPIKFDKKSKDTMEIALMVYKNILMGVHQDKILSEIREVLVKFDEYMKYDDEKGEEKDV